MILYEGILPRRLSVVKDNLFVAANAYSQSFSVWLLWISFCQWIK